MISSACAGGVNSTVHSKSAIQEHVDACVDKLFQKAGMPIPGIKQVIASWGDCFSGSIRRYCPVESVVMAGEGALGSLSCGLTDSFCALAGTGSDVFYIRNGLMEDAIGGWGYLLGDDGSGVWIGREAVRSTFHYLEGTAEMTHLHQLVMDHFQLGPSKGLIGVIYSAPSPPYQVGTVCRVVNRAAMDGDVEAHDILQRAGIAMGQEVQRMMKKYAVTKAEITTCGGVFQNCGHMRQAFEAYLKENCPGCSVHAPIFEPVIGCILYHIVQKQGEITPEILDFLQKEYHDFCVKQ